MSKKTKALQISALLTAVSGVTLVAASTSTVNAAEIRTVDERCWDQQPMTSREYRLNNCAFLEYGLRKADGSENPSNTSQSDDGNPDARDTGGPDPVDPYQQ